MVEQPGTIRVIRDGETLDRGRSSTSATGSRTAASRACCRSPSTPTTRSNRRFYVYYTNPTATSRSTASGASARRRRGADPGIAPQGDRDRAPAVRQPQRRPAAVRTRRACSIWAPATAAAPATRTATRRTATSCSASCCGSTRSARATATRTPEVQPVRGQARPRRDLRPRAAQPVPLLLRPPDRRHLHRRRRPGLLGGDRPRPRASALRGANFGWDVLRGQPRLRGRRRAARPLPAAGRSSTRRRAAHCAVTGGVRRPRPAAAGARRPLRLRRLLRRRPALVRPRPARADGLGRPGLHVWSRPRSAQTADGRLYVTSLAGEVSGSPRAEPSWDARASRGMVRARLAPSEGRLNMESATKPDQRRDRR